MQKRQAMTKGDDGGIVSRILQESYLTMMDMMTDDTKQLSNTQLHRPRTTVHDASSPQ